VLSQTFEDHSSDVRYLYQRVFASCAGAFSSVSWASKRISGNTSGTATAGSFDG